MATLTQTPSISSASTTQPRIKLCRFGDGYIQRAADGINIFPETWDLTFAARTDTEANAIEQVFKDAAGGTLLWTPPGSTQRKWFCQSWRRQRVDQNVNTITASLEEVFE